MKRTSGVLMHISSLPGEYSCGSFGRSAYKFVDFLRECGFTWWQTLPIGLCDECDSPYKSYSAFAGNFWFIDIEELFEAGLVTADELDSSRQKTPYVCEFERQDERLELLRSASKRCSNREEIDNFISSNEHLKNFCRFMALKAANMNKPWNEWENDRFDSAEHFMWEFIQFEFFRQWKKLSSYAASRGIKLIGDIPFYVSYDSSDVWSEGRLFELDEHGNPLGVAGVPPDYFSTEGQLWGNPLYNWEEMKSDGYKWWKDRVAHQLSMFDCVRIDHFRGIESFWRVPGNETTAKNGKWIKGPGKELVSAIKEASGEKLIIAEDLGEITANVERLVLESGFPGMRVFQFAFLGGDNPHLPHNYINNCVAYSGTHDNNTLLGYLWELDTETRKRMLEYCGFHGNDWGRATEDIIRTLFSSHAGTVIFPIQDLLGFGCDTRMNTPGTANGNWKYRVTDDQLSSIDRNKYLKMNQLYSRI